MSFLAAGDRRLRSARHRAAMGDLPARNGHVSCPSFFTGTLILRFGVVKVMAVGSLILLAGVARRPDGPECVAFPASPSCSMGSAGISFSSAPPRLVTTCYRPAERGKAQALNDFLIFGTTASASFLAGFLQEQIGWIALNWMSIALVTVSIAAVLWLSQQRQLPLRTH